VACRLKRTWRVPPKRIPPVGLTGEYTGGMLTFTNEDIWAKLASETGNDSSSIDFLPFSDVEASVKGDVRTIRESPFLPKDVDLTGWIYDTATGRLREVV
jgi:carbonic anhydrase